MALFRINKLPKIMSLKVEVHPRGHVALCNGPIHRIPIKIEQNLDDPPGNAEEMADRVQEWTKRESERKALKLAKFQRTVKTRVNARERLMQQEMAATSSKAMQSDAEKALKLDKSQQRKVKHSGAIGHDVEDVKMMASGRDSHSSHFQNPTNPSAVQAARNALLLHCNCHITPKPQIDDSSTLPQADTPSLSQKTDKTNYKNVEQLECARTLSSESRETDTDRYIITKKQIIKKFTAPGQIEHMEQKHAGKQYLLFRRLYSDLEREQVRKRKIQTSYFQKVESLKRKKEEERKAIESEMYGVESLSIISTDESEEKERATEWAELMLLEERKRKLQKAKETDRYILALKAKLKDHIELMKLYVPPLCSCGKTVWDTDPNTCANNCVFYQNTKGYVKALSNLLQSLNIY